MKIRLKKIQNGIYLGILLLIIKTVFYYSTVLPYNNFADVILQCATVILFVIEIIKQRYSYKTLLIYAIVAFASMFSCYKVGEWGMLISVITILAIRRENLCNVLDFIYTYELLFVVLNIVIAIFSLPFGGTITSTYYGETVLTLGFVHRNALSCFIFNLLLLWIWKNYEKLTTKTILKILCVVMLLFFLIKTKTTAIIMSFVIILNFLFRKTKSESRLLEFTTAMVIPAFSYGFYWMITHFGSMFSLFIDRMLTYRVQQSAYLFSKYGVSFWGQAINDLNAVWDSVWQLNGKLTFDCLYTYLLISRGIVWIVLIGVLFILLASKRNNKVNIFLIAWALYGVTEVGGTNCYQLFPILLVTLLFDNKIKEIT